MTIEEYIDKAAGTREIVAAVVRELMPVIKAALKPEFSSDQITVEDAAALTGIPTLSIREGIINGWLPIGIATYKGKQVTERTEHKGRVNFIILPERVWEVTGHVWRGKAALKRNADK